MHSVIETNAYLAAADDAGMTEVERDTVVDIIAAEPEAGAIMPRCAKTSCPKTGNGQVGRIPRHYLFRGKDVPVFLLTVFGKGEKDNLDKSERNALAMLTKTLKESLSSE